ncbi:unnamed protein product [Didymodactylos carnosus]|uniref:Uncharacterized protein n=1 Tax=Didymodactylos carnosus TaxID=1234261 RepID=A0A815BTD5_9BILA|nr:unnamed protein product [Didymodactylos carnosus]CAF1277305.1 unnamed protein product [Didymodactylos carnosus]CAF3677036.1 unnamed protein product [Didymodactylos carnosus]CAF4069799.1 unnamed protein product [Didymodactylos carnosus]
MKSSNISDLGSQCKLCLEEGGTVLSLNVSNVDLFKYLSVTIDQLLSSPNNSLVEKLALLLQTVYIRRDNEHKNVIIEALEKTGHYLSGIQLSFLFDKIIEQNDNQTLHIFVKHVKDLSEKQLCRAMIHLQDDLSVIFLHRRYNNQALTLAIRSTMDGEQISRLLEKFYDMLSTTTLTKDTCQIYLDWICCLIDSQFSTFVFQKHNRQLIKKLFSLVELYLDLFENLDGLDAYIEHFKQTQTTTPTTIKHQPYTIEFLHIN